MQGSGAHRRGAMQHAQGPGVEGRGGAHRAAAVPSAQVARHGQVGGAVACRAPGRRRWRRENGRRCQKAGVERFLHLCRRPYVQDMRQQVKYQRRTRLTRLVAQGPEQDGGAVLVPLQHARPPVCSAARRSTAWCVSQPHSAASCMHLTETTKKRVSRLPTLPALPPPKRVPAHRRWRGATEGSRRG